MRLTAEQRRNEVIAALTRDGGVTVNSLAVQFNVSMETIRKDIRFWEEKGVLRKTHGGAMLVSEDTVRHISKRLVENLDAKERLAEKAMEYIPESGVVFLDCGSTILCLARHLSVRTGLTIITNSVIVVNALADTGNRVHILGGQVRGNTMSTVGLWSAHSLESVRVDVAALGCSGFKGFDGPTSEDFDDAEVKRILLARSRFTMILADNGKFESSGLVSYCSWRDADLFLTNAGADPEMARKIRLETKLIEV